MSAADDGGMSPAVLVKEERQCEGGMSPAVLVKEEEKVWEVNIIPAALHVKAEPENDGGMSPATVLVKEEWEWDAAGLYADHEVKGELMLGSERRQPQDIVFTIQPVNATNTVTVKQEPSEESLIAKLPGQASHLIKSNKQLALRASYVKLERIHVYKELHKCMICQKLFLHKSSLMIHMSTHTSSNILISKKVFRDSEKKHCMYSCNVCGKWFATKCSTVVHLQTHTDKPYCCKICTKMFTSESQLTAHSLRHTEVKVYSCKICTEQFKHEGHLRTHELCHTIEKRFTCEICEKLFAQISDLASHKLRSHTEKPIVLKTYVPKHKLKHRTSQVCDKS